MIIKRSNDNYYNNNNRLKLKRGRKEMMMMIIIIIISKKSIIHKRVESRLCENMDEIIMWMQQYDRKRLLGMTGLVSLFNGILTFVGYLMPKPS